jgi:hypothetical protein
MAMETPSKSSTTVIRTAFALEAAGNIIGAIFMFINPSGMLYNALPSSLVDSSIFHPATASPSPQAATLVTWIGAIIIGLTPQLLLTLPEKPQAIASRQLVYVTLLAGEVALIVVIVWQAVMFDERTTGMSKKAMGFCLLNFVSLAFWRIFVLICRPNWFGDMHFEAGKLNERKIK